MLANLDQYFAILIFAALTAAFLFSLLMLGIFLGPRKRTPIKDQPFECGTVGSGSAGSRHSVKFYLVAMTFIIFDVEIVFLYPWAVNLRTLGWYGLWAIAPFFLLLVVGLLYEWRRGVLDL